MRIGFSSIFAWRPHVEHLHYLAMLARSAGHEARFLACDGDLPSCYSRELRPDRAAWKHCAQCRLGGIRSFEARHVDSIGHLAAVEREPAKATQWGLSSAATIGRFEAPDEFSGPECGAIAQRLERGARRAYSAARRWIETERLDALCVFNGRMDATRGLVEAARDAGVPFVSVERTWFGDGMQLLPNENCLGLRAVDEMMIAWRDIPLTREQALRAGAHAASRFLRRNGKEWRAYNTQAQVLPWPAAGRRRVLFTPSSRNEVWAHPDWELRWPDQTAGFDALTARLGLEPEDVVVRAHPNWAERIGLRDGARSEAFFRDWAQRRGIHYIAAADRTSTLGLIEQADAIVVCGGSAALEAGILGKQVISLGSSIYRCAGFESPARDEADLVHLVPDTDLEPPAHSARADRVARLTLRFCYTMAYRAAQFVPYVRAASTTRYEYFGGASPSRLEDLLQGGALSADDATIAGDTRGEDEALGLIAERRWAELMQRSRPLEVPGPVLTVGRRPLWRPIDVLRDRLPRGDL
jgi:hypothetical protein